jgi:hypothetical protein
MFNASVIITIYCGNACIITDSFENAQMLLCIIDINKENCTFKNVSCGEI